MKVFLSRFWHWYGSICLDASHVFAKVSPEGNKLIDFMDCIRLRIALGLLKEAEKAYKYRDWLVKDFLH